MTEHPETDPTGRQPGDLGRKTDAGKPDMLTALREFPRALAAISELAIEAANDPNKGYALGSWRYVPDGLPRYEKALTRHLVDKDRRAVAWNALAALEFDLIERETAKAEGESGV